MSRFVLDCAVCRPVNEEIGRWLATSAQRAWAPAVAGYHEGKVSQALLAQSAATLAQLAGGAVAWFAPDPALALRSAVAHITQRASLPLITSLVDTVAVLDTVHEAAARHGVSEQVLGVDSDGRIHPDALARLTQPVTMVTALGNQEIGTLQQDLGPWKTSTGSTVILDARCAFGWTELPDYWDLLILDPRAWGHPREPRWSSPAPVRPPLGLRQRARCSHRRTRRAAMGGRSAAGQGGRRQPDRDDPPPVAGRVVRRADPRR